MTQRFVTVSMRMRYWIRHLRVRRAMHVCVMSIMHMRMLVLHRLVNVLMFVTLAQMQPHADSHESCSTEKRDRWPFTENNQRDDRADEWCGREVRTGAGRSELTKS